MNRRHALGALAGVSVAPLWFRKPAEAAPVGSIIPGAIPFVLDKAIRLDAKSTAVHTNGGMLHIVSIDTGVFTLDKTSHLRAVLNGGVYQYAKVDYWISAAVFDSVGKFLGSAIHKEAVHYVRLSAMPMVYCEMELDFGISRAYKSAAVVTLAISDREVPKPD